MMIPRAIVTGAYGAIGQAIAQGIAHYGFELMLVGRNEKKLQETKTAILKNYPDTAIGYGVVDLSRQKEIEEFASAWKGALHVLVNNAATAPRARMETPEGIEMQWATNVLGYYWMDHHFAPHLKGQPNARIVHVASYWAGGLDLSDPEYKKRYYNNDKAYRQSKQADRMLAAWFAEKLKKDGVCVNACHPGDVNSKVSNDLGYGGHETPSQGADTPVWLATSNEVEDKTGHYYEQRKKVHCPYMEDKKGIEQLVELCKKYSQ